MSTRSTHTINAIIETLLQIANRVIVVSSEGEIVQFKDRVGSEAHLAVINNTVVAERYCAAINECLTSRKSEQSRYSVVQGDTVYIYRINVLPAGPEMEDGIFLVISFHAAKRAGKVTEDYWKLAMDAAGDGMWDVNIPEQTISFSDKWQQTFGYDKDQIIHLVSWTGFIHPEDRQRVVQDRDDFFAGKVKNYNSEFRLLCADGTYKWVLSRGMIVARHSDGTPLRFVGTHTDISQLKEAEEKYYSAAQLLSRLVNNLRDGILVVDEHKKILFANQVYCDIYNIADHPSALNDMDVYKSIAARMHHYKDSQGFYDRTVQLLNLHEMVLDEEWEMVDGRIVGRDYIPLVLGKNRKGGIWKFRDVTAQKSYEKQLASLRNFYEQILNHIAADIVVFDQQLRYIFINPTAVKDKELREWMIGKTDEDYVKLRNKPRELVERRQRIFYEALEKKHNIEWEEMLINRDGNPEYHLRNHYPVFDEYGKHLMSIGYGLNITDRVRAQQELKTSRDTFASAFNDSGIGMALISHEGMWLDANPVLCSLTGYTNDELRIRSLHDITHPDDVALDREYMVRMLSGEITTYNVEKRFIARTGKVMLVSLTMSLVRDTEGLPKFFIVQAIDITDKKEMEQELRNKNAELEQTRLNLLSKVNQLEELSHIIAHNLRGPAGNIRMLSDTLLEQHERAATGGDTNDVFTQEEGLTLIRDSSRALMNNLATLMQVTEIKLGKDIPFDECNVSELVADISDQLKGSIVEKQAQIITDTGVPVIFYPRMYLYNILYNLVSNALKYSVPGLIPEIRIVTDMKEGRVRLIVKDNGLGIDLERFGDKVFRLNQVFHEGYESKGVGLYLTRTTVESLGGKIEVTSAPGEGCEFIVTF